jgi:hypothetical protein
MKSFLLALISLFIVNCLACKKNITAGPETETDIFRFTYNNTVINYRITGNNLDAAPGFYFGEPILFIDMPNIFKAPIQYHRTGCAFMGREVTVRPGCVLLSNSTSPPSSPIDSTEVFYYESGVLNLSVSNCVTKSGYDFWTGQNYTQTICAIKGTFDLTLTNKNNDKIKITNGEVNFHKVAKQ